MAEAAGQLDVKPEAIDREFGIVAIDPANDTYCVLVDEGSAPQVARHGNANPKIEPISR